MNISFGQQFAIFLRILRSGYVKNNRYHVLALVFVYYASLRFRRFRNTKVKIKTLPGRAIACLIDKYYGESEDYVDFHSCALGNLEFIDSKKQFNWVNICSSISRKKYKMQLIQLENGEKNEIYIAETSLHNIENLFENKNAESFFILPCMENLPRFGQEVKISLISNPHECPDNLIDTLLKNYFSDPRYLRKNDVICIPILEYAPDFFYVLHSSQLTQLYFKVKSVKFDGRRSERACYVFHNETKLILDNSIHEYLPRQYQIPIIKDEMTNIVDELRQCSISNCPKSLDKYIDELETCILPFMQSEKWMDIKPVFLVEGSKGSGKNRLISCLAKRLGLNFNDVDCSEIQTLSPSQTEAKLRLALSNSEHCVPCILKLSNIQIFGKNSEGKIDERITSNFSDQLNNLYEKKMKHPLIVIATVEGSEISPNIDRNFIERIKIEYLCQDDKIDIIEWILKSRKFEYSADISKVVSMCSDLVFNDLETLTLNAAKNCYKRTENHKTPMKIETCDFIQSFDSMQEIFSEEIGAPKIPKVHWDDIGGLVNLKHEIIRRIEIPLLHNSGIQCSGVLLYGPPGTGKTLLAKAVATECKLNFLSVKGPELLNMYVGQSEKNVREVFERARAASPCIIFFDELDALAPNRGRSGDSGGVMDRVVSQLLAEMDGLGSSTTTFIIGATNRPDLIDPALLRPGRFDKLLYVGIYSDRESQLSVLQAITRKFAIPDANNLLLRVVEKLPSNLTGADLQSVCSNAWLNAARRIIKEYEENHNCDNEGFRDSVEMKPEGPVMVGIEDFLEAIENAVPSVTKDELRRYEKLHEELTSK